MSLFKSLADKVRKEKEDLKQKAAERAAEAALEKGKDAAVSAAKRAGRRIEEALFGPDSEEAPPSKRKKAPKQPPADAPSEEVARPKADARSARELLAEKARREAKLDEDVDKELAALKKKLGKK